MKNFTGLLLIVFLTFILLTSNIFAAGPQPTQPAQPVRSITLLSPKDGDEWIFGLSQKISWVSKGINKVNIYLWFLDGRSYIIAENVTTSKGVNIYRVMLNNGQQYLGGPKIIAGHYKIVVWSNDWQDQNFAVPFDIKDISILSFAQWWKGLIAIFSSNGKQGLKYKG